MAQDRQAWHRVCEGGSSVNSTAQDSRFYCDGCQHSFSSSQDKARHCCNSVRSCCVASNVSASVAKLPVLIIDEIFGAPRICQGTSALEPEDYKDLSMRSGMRQKDITL